MGTVSGVEKKDILCFSPPPTDVYCLNSTEGRPPFKDMGLGTSSLPPEFEDVIVHTDCPLRKTLKTQLRKLLNDYRDIFSLKGEPFGRTGLVQHKIHTDSTAPIRQDPRRIPIHQVDLVEEAMEDMKKLGVMRPSESPWVSPVIIVHKKDEGCQMCINYMPLNEVNVKDAQNR